MLAQDSRPWTGIQWLGDHIIPKVKVLLCTWMSTGRTHKTRAWTPPPQDHWIQRGLWEGRSSQGRHTSALLLQVFVPRKLLFLLLVYTLMFSVTFAIADALGKCGLNLGELLVRQGGRTKTHRTRNRSLCAAWQEPVASTVRTGEKNEFKKEDTTLDEEIPSINVGRYWWQEDKYVLDWGRKREVYQQKQIKGPCFVSTKRIARSDRNTIFSRRWHQWQRKYLYEQRHCVPSLQHICCNILILLQCDANIISLSSRLQPEVYSLTLNTNRLTYYKHIRLQKIEFFSIVPSYS